MLKINLLPGAPQRGGGQQSGGDIRIFGAAVAILLVLMGTGILLFHGTLSSELGKLNDANAQRESAVRAIRSRVSDHPRVQQELGDIRARREAISRLEQNRTGPTAMLVEVSQLLSPGGRPTNDPAELERIQRDDPTRMFNPTWDPHTLWLTSFSETERNVVVEGYGRSANDVAEFMRRMMLSQYFEGVALERSEGAQEEVTHLSVQRFKITARVRY
ncbi:MAG: PilN domain-containing protein [Deltaproteobacteria bacterium]|nr:PilN domain-containing protein [Deltaproteobacteria bacterium]